MHARGRRREGRGGGGGEEGGEGKDLYVRCANGRSLSLSLVASTIIFFPKSVINLSRLKYAGIIPAAR
jgi:hypothetical protein